LQVVFRKTKSMKTIKLNKRTLFVFKNNNFKNTKLHFSNTSDPTTTTLTLGTTGFAPH
jgi:hypothetical protein